MASLKPVLKDFVKESGKSTIFIRISHDGKTRYVKSIYEIEPKYMNIDGSISGKYSGSAKLNLNLNILLSEYNGVLADIGADVAYLDINTIVKRLKYNESGGVDFIKYTKERIKILESENRTSYVQGLESLLVKMKGFSGKEQIFFKEITLDFLTRFERFLVLDEKKVNTIGFYMNKIKTIFNHAIDNDIIKIELFPFRKFKIKTEKTRKRNLTIIEIQKLLSLKLSAPRKRTLDLFMLSFYLLGMNFKDMLYLTTASVSNGRIIYNRYKTGGQFSILLQPEAKAIFNRYKGEKYLLRFVEQNRLKRKTDIYNNTVIITNRILKNICKQAEISSPVSTYYARHSWATIASSIGISRDIIRYALGHNIQTITDIYIEYDYSQVDDANRKVIDAVKQ